jgi:hypothetical protein
VQQFTSQEIQGVPIGVFMKHCPLLQNTSAFAKDRVMQALGVDIGSKSTVVSFETYLQLWSYLRIQTTDKAGQRRFAVRLFDPNWSGQLSYKQLKHAITQFYSSSEPGASSFAASIVEKLLRLGFVSKTEPVDPERLLAAIEQNVIELEVLLSTI